ncbi:aliphatic sulfonate ABC transporter substrate-binding protein [Streptomyces rapamycinicus]|uniref:Sulfate ABC transporter substrate-binding protein n=2 Tax=Streptomyces rapamycinicus TaxID=1226757 RepID=A0A3L8R1T1_STRRN|nr:aliphatic sulfonate ABC transporter substrate-binding protein [Streptomyces rapamycinicus]MBB4781870.1 NitT/TauT family transport system substrate-binding protein [Streptomyces rapamycinicus]RLV73487.1 sulfate ABC transporter substrate-binding protein [Streptomyces rapamycinicus NRRL 5491]UTO62431.1 aliphatic sulfonate ABC transporter substrate-binding protein [Streptomyces rapamycinicus]UTP30386.1 aliphatic sulfonate ABC transporter substrate-binding protein [Streptomyces rapamycinicus NRRL
MSSAVRLIAPRPATHPRRRTRILAAAAVLPLLMGTLGACGYGSEKKNDDTGSSAVPAAGGAKVDGLDKVKVGYFANLTHATALVGLRKGGPIQQELKGTKVSPYVFNAGPSEIEALNAGSIDMGWIGPSPSINGYVKSHGSNLKIISGSVSGGVKLVVNPKKIKTLDDVKGKKIATPQLGNTQDVAFLNWVKSKGWKVDAQSGKGDVSVVRSDNKVTPDAYKSGAIDGAWVPEPTASKLVADGGKVLLDESSLWPDKKFVITNLIVKQSFLAEHPKVVEAVLRGSVKTNAFIKANPEQAKNAANAALEEETGKPLPADVIDPAWKSIQVTDDPLASTLNTEADHAVQAGLLEKPDLKGIYDLGPLNKVLKAEGKPAVSAAGLGSQ